MRWGWVSEASVTPREAQRRKAEVIVTCCPLCQLNLECFQEEISRQFGPQIRIPVMYFTQLMGVAYGIPEKDLGIQRLFVRPAFLDAVKEGGITAHVA